MKRYSSVSSLLVLGAAVVLQTAATADDDRHHHRTVRARLVGVNEIPAVSTDARAWFRAEVDSTGTMITYELSYQDLEGAVSQAHLHVGQAFANGGISVWLCGNANPTGTPPINPPVGTQPCPASPAKITGTIKAMTVVGPPTQGIGPGELAELMALIRRGLVYANVHTSMSPGGEIRGQLF
jgi:CHRD domain